MLEATRTQAAKAKLSALRQRMECLGVDSYLIPSCDPHNSEYVAARDGRREFISGFTGSSGTALVTSAEALLWTDGRYTIQAQEEFAGTEWQLMQQCVPETPSIPKWLAASGVRRIGYDPLVMTVAFFRQLEKELPQPDEDSVDLPSEETKLLVPVASNLVDEIWDTWEPPRPSMALKPVFLHPVSLSGASVSEKLENLRTAVAGEKCGAVALSALDDIAWLFNLRGSDVDFNPVFFGYALITPARAKLYIDKSRIEDDAIAMLAEAEVDLCPYNSLPEDLASLPTAEDAGLRYAVMMDNPVNIALYGSVPKPRQQVLLRDNPVKLMKCLKNRVEIQGTVDAHRRDAIAMIRFLAYMERAEADGSVFQETEVTLANRLDGYRSELENFVGLSFPTISAAGPNSAMPHYRATKSKCCPITESVYLFDSGAQFRDGTTDVTRCVRFGTPTDLEKKLFTLVLQGHLDLASVAFPKGTKGPHVDVLARQHLWLNGLDFRHGTGHGVGSFLNVHEGPCGITPGLTGPPAETAIEPGMVLSNEPGFYYDGHFGFRVENLMLCQEIHPPMKTDGLMGDSAVPVFAFEDLTLVPISRDLIDPSMLTRRQLASLNDYHQRVWDTMHELLTDPKDIEYLRTATRQIF